MGASRLDHLGELELLLHLRLAALGVLHGEERVPWDVDEVDRQQAVLEGDDLSLALLGCSPPDVLVTYALWDVSGAQFGEAVHTWLIAWNGTKLRVST